MPYDGSVLYAVKHELESVLKNGRLSKIYQPERFSVIFEIHLHKGFEKLLLSCDPSMPRAHLTSSIYDNPHAPPMFCMLLRKHLSGGKIVGFRQPDFERILEIDIEAMDEMGSYRVKTLLVEIMGKHSNIILIDPLTHRVYDALRRITPGMSGYRELVPGTKYVPPPNPGKLNPLNFADKLFNVLASNPSANIVDAIVGGFNGISPILAKSIIKMGNLDVSEIVARFSPKQITDLCIRFEHYFDQLKQKKFEPTVFFKPGGPPKDFHILPIAAYDSLKTKTFTSANDALDYFYCYKFEQALLNNFKQVLKKTLKAKINRAYNKKSLQENQLAETRDMEKFRIYGELITAYMFKIKQGDKFVTVDNFYENPPLSVTIPLNPEITPAQNAQRYFKKYNKLKSTLNHSQIFLNKTLQEIDYLEGVYFSVEQSSDMSSLMEIRSELEEAGILEPTGLHIKKHATVKSEPYKFVSTEGNVILIGKNNRQNDELTLKKAQADDYWFHTKGIPGAHVIVISEGKKVTETTIKEAAMLSAYYSKAKNSSNVPVDYTLKKYVYKPKGAKSGMVLYKNYHTIFVTPNVEIIEKLRFDS
jgi:predicted ribosome quality control (RQC) complex YloA/Tae2 family protein